MAKLIRTGAYYMEGRIVKEAQAFMTSDKKEKAVKNTLTYSVLKTHAKPNGEELSVSFDGIAADEAGIEQAEAYAKEAGIKRFSASASVFGEGGEACASAKQYGADFVPASVATPAQYLRDCVAESGKTLLCSFPASCGALGALTVTATGDAAGKQLVSASRSAECPEVVAVFLKGKLRKGAGAFDVVLDLMRAAGTSGFLQGKILEFVGTGVGNLSQEGRNDVDAALPLTGCLSAIWETDGKTEEYLRERGRGNAYRALSVVQPAYYDGAVTLDLSRVESMVALPLKKNGILSVRELIAQAEEISGKLEKEQGEEARLPVDGAGNILVSGGTVCGNAGSYETLAETAEMLRGKGIKGFPFVAVCASQPVAQNLADNGYLGVLAGAGVCVKTAGLAEMQKTGLRLVCSGETCEESGVTALADARTIAKTALNGGVLAPAVGSEYARRFRKYKHDRSTYEKNVTFASKPQSKRS